MSIEELCLNLGRSEAAVRIMLHRMGIGIKPVLELQDNITYRMMTKVYGAPLLFVPNREFYDAIKIGQKRFWMLYKGTVKAKNEEVKRIAIYLGLSYSDWVDSLQIDINFS